MTAANIRSSKNYKWIALSNTTLGVLTASINASILIISLPAIFRGIHMNPLKPANVDFLLWSLMGFMVCTAAFVVTFGKLGDMLGRVKMYNAGFVIFTLASIALSFTPGVGSQAALYIISIRIIQGLGGALLMANSTAILTDAFPVSQRGLALGINSIATIAGSLIGLVIGGLLADADWRAIFWVSVPVGIIGTLWAYIMLRDSGRRKTVSLDWLGNISFAMGLVLLLVGITYGIQPYGSHVMGWTSNPKVVVSVIGGVVLLTLFAFHELQAKSPMLNLKLFASPAFTAGSIASLLSAIGRGGLQFTLIIWLQGIWLPLHGYNFTDAPLWAGLYTLPLLAGFLAVGPVSGFLSDRFGARPFATSGMVVGAISFLLLGLLPANFIYWQFAVLLFLNGVGTGLFAAPNSTSIMNAAPPHERGQASGMRSTTMNAGTVLSIGIFFSLIIIGLSTTLPAVMEKELIRQHVPVGIAQHIAHEPLVSSLFAAFLGYNPMRRLIPPATLQKIPSVDAQTIVGKKFFPDLISGPFIEGIHLVFVFSAGLFMLSAIASWFRDSKYLLDAADPAA